MKIEIENTKKLETADIEYGSPDLLKEVRIAFIRQGTSLHGWCQHNGIASTSASMYLLGKRNGKPLNSKTARKWRRHITEVALGIKTKGK
jgi:hypothetical protein